MDDQEVKYDREGRAYYSVKKKVKVRRKREPSPCDKRDRREIDESSSYYYPSDLGTHRASESQNQPFQASSQRNPCQEGAMGRASSQNFNNSPNYCGTRLSDVLT